MADKIKYGVLGAGLIGTYLGGLLSAAGRNVTLVGRGRVQGEIAKAGLTLSHYDRKSLNPNGFIYLTDMKALAGCDVILICVKSQQSADVARDLAQYIEGAPLIISFQNGIGNADVMKEVLPGMTVLPGMVPFNVTSPAPGQFHQGTEGGLYIKAMSDHRLMDMKAAFESVGIEVDLRDPLLAVQWGKLLMNLNNALNTLHGGPLRAGLVQKDYRRVLARMIEEALEALRLVGIEPESPTSMAPSALPKLLRLPTLIYKFLMDRLLKIDPTARSSMLEDLELGRASENVYIQGEVLRLGRQVGASVETNRKVAEAVEAAFEAGASPRLTGAEMAKAFL